MDPKKLMKDEHKGNVGDVIQSLSQNDVLCGRGSGPNDHPGNVAFRQLIISRKAEYLSTTARAEKAKIASEIVHHVQNDLEPSGRFLKKMGPAELQEKGFQEGQDVWVVVDQDTALEKAKQALRQNRDKPLVEEELKKKRAERHEECAKLTEQAMASLKSNSAETATTSGTGGSTTRKSVASVASSLSSGVGGQAIRMEDPNTTGGGTFGSTDPDPHKQQVDAYAASGGDPLAQHPYYYVNSGGAAEHPRGNLHPEARAHPEAVPYPTHPMPPSDEAYNQGQYAYHPQYAHKPPPPPPPHHHHHHHHQQQQQQQQQQYPPHREGRAGRSGEDVTQSLRVSDLVNDFHRLGPGDGEVGEEPKTGGPVAREQFPYAFGDAGQGSSNVTMNSVSSAVSESDILAVNIDPIPVGGSEPAIDEEIPGPMSSGTIELVQQLTQSSGEGPDGPINATEQLNNRQQSFQQQQYMRHPGHQPGAHSYVQQYYYRSSMAHQQSSMRGSLRSSTIFGSNRSDMRSDMTMSMSLTELTKEPSGRNIAAYRQSVAAGDKGMQGIAEGEAGDEGSDNNGEDGRASGEPMSGSSAAAGSQSGSSSDKMSGMSSGSGMAASLASSGDSKPQALAVAPRPVELIQEEPDNLAFGASSASMIKAVFDTSSGSNFSTLSKMSGILSGDDELKPAAATDSEGKAKG